MTKLSISKGNNYHKYDPISVKGYVLAKSVKKSSSSRITNIFVLKMTFINQPNNNKKNKDKLIRNQMKKNSTIQ